MSTPDIKAQTVKLGGKDYVQVAGRVLLAHADNDKLDIITEVVSITDQTVTMKATVTTRKGVFTGHAVSRTNAKGIESQSPLEVAETSAVGRALGYAGYAIEGGIASADEVQAAQRETTDNPRQTAQQTTDTTTTGEDPRTVLSKALNNAVKQNRMNVGAVKTFLTTYQVNATADMTPEQAVAALIALRQQITV